MARSAANYRMRDLCQATGLERQTIHFYIQEGLLPEGKKTGRNMAYYGEDHLERLRLIKKLQEERFLPLRAIRAVLGGKSGGFSKEQRKLLADVKTRLLDAAPGRALVGGPTELVGASEVADAHGVKAGDVEEMIELGLLASEGSSKKIRRDDAWLVVPARADDVFAAPEADLWADVLRRRGGPYAMLALMPDDPSVN